MFTGIITHIGTVARIQKSGDWKFTIAASGITRGLKIGASVACNGVCLTVIGKDAESFTVQVSQETLRCTTLANWQSGTRINLERALKAGDELGGHFVSGHVDGVVALEKMEAAGESKVMWLYCHPRESGDPSEKTISRRTALKRDSRLRGNDRKHLIVPKGSVTLDGVSLTVNQVKGAHFSVNIIPHTQKATTLGERKAGDTLNFEPDLAARYLVR